MATKLLAVLATLGGAAGAAAAQPPAEPDFAPPASVIPEEPPATPPPLLRFHVGGHGGLRLTAVDGHAGASRAQLSDAGWVSTTSPALYGFGLEAQYLHAPLVDVGLAWSWARADHAGGVDFMDDRVRTDVSTVGAVMRLHWSRGRPFIPEPRVDVGLMRVTTVLHGTEDTRTTPYLRGGIDWRLGTRRGGVQIAVGYTITGRASPEELDLATGGLGIDVGPYLRF